MKWATCNVGANSSEEYGDYYAWGETETKDEYTKDNSMTCGMVIKDISGDLRYDVARRKWGGRWRIPTEEEMEELIEKCTWEWTEHNGTKGYKVTGSNGKSIFLPATGYRLGSSLLRAGGYGYYLSSTSDESYSDYAYGLHFYFYSGSQDVDWIDRNLGLSVRPVSE